MLEFVSFFESYREQICWTHNFDTFFEKQISQKGFVNK